MIVCGGASVFKLLERELCYLLGIGWYRRCVLLYVLLRYQGHIGGDEDFAG